MSFARRNFERYNALARRDDTHPETVMKKQFVAATAAVALAIGGAAAGGTQAGPVGVYNSPYIQDVQFQIYFFGGHRYCWYDGGWRGPGWYWCGYPWRGATAGADRSAGAAGWAATTTIGSVTTAAATTGAATVGTAEIIGAVTVATAGITGVGTAATAAITATAATAATTTTTAVITAADRAEWLKFVTAGFRSDSGPAVTTLRGAGRMP